VAGSEGVERRSQDHPHTFPTFYDGFSSIAASSLEVPVVEVWVDPTTYPPIRMTEHGSFGAAELDYSWIPKSDPSAAGIFEP
jgi:hypothetical protein